MTLLKKPVTRESEVLYRGRPLIVSLHPRFIEVRPKGTRECYTLAYDGVLSAAAKRKLGGKQ